MNLVFGWDIWMNDALETYFQAQAGINKYLDYDTMMKSISETSKAKLALKTGADTLDGTPGIALDQAINANKALIIIEGEENSVELKK